MNDRIKELLQRTGIDFGNSESVTVDFEQMEEFAELVVEECANVCSSHAWGLIEHGMSGAAEADYCANLIVDILGDNS